MTKIRLETRDGKFVANVTPVVALEEPQIFLLWGQRFFKLWNSGTPAVYRETRITVVRSY